MKSSGWGRYPTIEAQTHYFRSTEALVDCHRQVKDYIPQGNRRSYGDSALYSNIINTTQHRFMLFFDENSGVLTAQAGLLLSDVVKTFLPRGWFLKVTPGTQFITLGGAIASDVHGKNHHVDGCFSECLVSFKLLLPDETVVECSTTKNVALFRATCGGMGLTGIILEATIKLQKVGSSYIQQTAYKTKNLEQTMVCFQENAQSTYSVAWIDCLAKGASLGRGIMSVGEFCDDGVFHLKAEKKLTVPIDLPSMTLNKTSIKIFNYCYYHKQHKPISQQRVACESFFYPLDSVANWNRIYGKNGFMQYQFILPLATSFQGMQDILSTISASGMGSFLAVLKLYGSQNKNYLSFPMEGYSLALDFKIQPRLFELLDDLDNKVLHYGGRVYLAKDARMSKSVFNAGYPRKVAFKKLRKQYHMMDKLNSLQSRRLGI